MTDKENIRNEVKKMQKRAEHNFDISLTENERLFWLGESNVLTLIGKYIDSLQEEPVSKDLEKENKIEILADIIFNAAKHGYMPYDTQDEYCAMEIAKRNIDKFIVPKKQEEPVSNPINFEQELYKAFGQVKDFTLCMRIAKWFYDMGKNSQEPVSEELEEAASIYQTFHRFSTPYKAFIEGAQWQKEKMMANATNVTVHIDAGGYPYTPEIELYDYDKDVPLAKEGDKYKVVLIKEN